MSSLLDELITASGGVALEIARRSPGSINPATRICQEKVNASTAFTLRS
jgi:hypothetical protein